MQPVLTWFKNHICILTERERDREREEGKREGDSKGGRMSL